MGRIVGLFGVRGWVKIHSYTEPREAILGYKGWKLAYGSEWRPVEVAEGKRHGKSVIARLHGYDDRDAAAGLVDKDIGVDRDAMPKLAEGEYYWADLEGMAVVHKDGKTIGRVAYVMATGANDVLVTEGPEERLIPFVRDSVILDVDLDNRVISVDWEWD